MFKEHGHTVAMRFDGWSQQIAVYQSVCQSRLGSEYKNFSWSSHFGTRNSRTDIRPYWITFRNESDLTLVLLSVQLTK